ncbi:hypothetical protein DSL72_002998 [Monilinia vaccinii-corymbosi]|uniref:Aminotransferase class V domain-containing protein n=1 Tax=Monilinia vaccinii-corymbosi TaxID=61207 RepID=A0A8A3P122_9HELO|nr:hypothetical protein DSL72_002998 [Monilinia vaccinii-corymbosi]
MGESVAKLGEVALNDSITYQATPFGKEMAKHFLFEPGWRNLNHGSFGTVPRAIREKQRRFQDDSEARPDEFIHYTYPRLLDESREALGKLLNVPTSTVVFVPNATTGVNTVLRNLVWNEDGKDEILYFSTIYGACGLTIKYVSEANRGLVQPRQITCEHPIEDDELVGLFEKAIETSRAEGKRPRAAVFDIVGSLPGLRVPYERYIAICKREGLYSIVDGAHGIGHVALDLSILDPDFFVSNCHKWLFVPRGCAVFYVPERNQDLMRTSLPTSHGFVPKGPRPFNPLPPSAKSDFVTQFEFVGTIDNTNYLCTAEAIKWRNEVCGGEQAIMDYCSNLSREGGKSVAEILGTEVLDNSTNTLTDCCLVNVLLPLEIGTSEIEGFFKVTEDTKMQAYQWMLQTLIKDYKTYIPIAYLNNKWWARLSGQVYLEKEDFEWAGRTLNELCARVGKGEYVST